MKIFIQFIKLLAVARGTIVAFFETNTMFQKGDEPGVKTSSHIHFLGY